MTYLAARLTISRVLYRFGEPAAAIHLGLQLPTGSSNQPGSYPNPVNASLFGLAPSEVYLAPYVTIPGGALLPHLFSLTNIFILADYFLLHYLSGRPALPLAGTLIHEVLGLSSPAINAAATTRHPRGTTKGTCCRVSAEDAKTV